MVTGETPNLAARLESVAPPGGVAIGGTTRALVHAAFDLEFLGPQNLKGFSAPVDTWLVRAEREVESRFEESGARLTAFTGRTHEVGLLLDRWRQVQDGDGQVVLISGEPGIGKSRIVQAVRERIDGDRHRRIFYQCSPHHVNTALHPAIRQFEHAAGIAADDAAVVKLDRIEAVLRQASADIAQVAPLIAALLSIPFEDRYGALDMAPQQQRTATLRALSDQLLELARNEPVLFVLEDAHWIDPTTQELIVETVPRLTNRRVLMLITHRPEWRDPFHGLSHVTTLNMTRLSRTQIGEMVHDVAGRDLPEATVTRIVERTDGVPLFIEELTKAMAEAGFDLADEDVPATLQASLLARLDRLGPAKEIAQIGAVIGRDFSRDMLARITEERVDLDAGLERLIDSQLIFRTRHREGDGYTFKHALVQDIAYDSLLRQRRQRLHLAIAQVFAAGDGPEVALEVLARHFERGSDLVRAMDVWEKAGDAAAARPAQPEAAANYGKALHLRGNNASVSPDDPGTLSLLLRLGQAQFGTLGGGDPLTLSTFQRACTLAKRLGDPVDTCIALYGAWVSLIIAARMDETIAVAKELTQLAGPDSEPWMRATAYRAMGSTQFLMGRFPESEDTYKQCLATIDSGLDEYPAALAHDPALTAPAVLANVEWTLGERELALKRSEACIDIALRQHRDPNTKTFVLTWHLMLCLMDRNAERMIPALETLREHSTKTRGTFPNFALQMATGGFETLRGNSDAGIRNLREGLKGWLGAGALQTAPFYTIFLAEAYRKNGEPAIALDVLEEAGEIMERTGQRVFEPEMHRCRGVVFEGLDRIAEAKAAFQSAIAVAEEQGSLSWRERAAVNLSALDVGG